MQRVVCWILVLSIGLWSACSSLKIQKQVAYSDWKPIISAEDVYKKFISFLYLSSFDNRLFWVEARPAEQGRYVIVSRGADGAITDLTPQGFSARSRVYEYGGPSYTAHKGNLYFINFQDQRIYWQDLDSPTKIRPLTPTKNADGSLGKYMDFMVSPDGKWLVFVYEKEYANKENLNFIAAINLEGKKQKEPIILASGADFYKTPLFSKDGTKLVWQQWNHPYMPWDSTNLYMGSFQAGKIKKLKKVIGGNKISVNSVALGDKGELYFTADWPNQRNESPKNYYNIYQYQNGEVKKITDDLGEYSNLQVVDQGLLAVYTVEGDSVLKVINPANGLSKVVAAPYNEFKFLTVNNVGEWLSVVDSPTEAPKIINLSAQNVVKVAYHIPVDKENISIPQKIKFPTSDGEFAYGHLYLPKNKNYLPLRNKLPPVRVLLHGGPTYRASTGFSLSKVFWTGQGHALFDVDYRGSTGYGRKYRDALLGKWGLLEVEDVKDGLQYLRKQGLISNRAFVSGQSAGGYSVQRLLTRYPGLFQGGASHFGIGNLVTLQHLTHKFESHYLVQLIGDTLEANKKEYEARSPINHLEKLIAPMIIFQGSEDKIVPPENSREMAAILRKRGIYHEYYEYEGEDHGFQKKENLVNALTQEATFFKKVLKGKIAF